MFDYFINDLKRMYMRNRDLDQLVRKINSYELMNGELTAEEVEYLEDTLNLTYDLRTILYRSNESDNSDFLNLLNKTGKKNR